MHGATDRADRHDPERHLAGAGSPACRCSCGCSSTTSGSQPRRCSPCSGATDWVDGWIARHFDQGSDLGKVLDPVADRILLLVAGVALVVDGSVPLVVGRPRARARGWSSASRCSRSRRPVPGASTCSGSGKAGTLALMFAFPLFLWADSIDGARTTSCSRAAWFFAVVGLVLRLLRGAHLRPARAARRCAKAGRPPTPRRPAAGAGSVTR